MRHRNPARLPTSRITPAARPEAQSTWAARLPMACRAPEEPGAGLNYPEPPLSEPVVSASFLGLFEIGTTTSINFVFSASSSSPKFHPFFALANRVVVLLPSQQGEISFFVVFFFLLFRPSAAANLSSAPKETSN